jgi:nucleotide-binding universal stress UspA family protein
MFKRILVALDGSSRDRPAVMMAVDLARSTGARVTRLRMVPTTALAGASLTARGADPWADIRWDDAAFAGAQCYVDVLTRRMQQADVQAYGRALVGEASPTLPTRRRLI